MSDDRSLSEKMIDLAATHPRGDELRERATALRDAAAGFYAREQTVTPKQFLGCWARARRLWSELSGEPLL